MALFYDRDHGQNTWNRGYDRGYRTQPARGAYDRGYRSSGDRYDRGYKSRWQTDYGDPFNDRGTNTPMYMTRGEFRADRDRGFGRGSNYDRDYSANPMGYDPYYDQSPRSSRDVYDRGYRGWGVGNEGSGNRGFGNQGYGNRGFGNRSFGKRGFGASRGYDAGWF